MNAEFGLRIESLASRCSLQTEVGVASRCGSVRVMSSDFWFALHGVSDVPKGQRRLAPGRASLRATTRRIQAKQCELQPSRPPGRIFPRSKNEMRLTPGRMERSLLGKKPRVFTRSALDPGLISLHPFGMRARSAHGDISIIDGILTLRSGPSRRAGSR